MAAPKPKFWSSGSLRIMDVSDLHDEITDTLGDADTCHKKGEIASEVTGRTWTNDIWIKESPVPERSEIVDHLEWLCDFVAPYEKDIKDWISRGARVDFYFSYDCDHDHCGFGLPPELLSVFSRLGIRFEVSIITSSFD